jgi:hypothetical protein
MRIPKGMRLVYWEYVPGVSAALPASPRAIYILAAMRRLGGYAAIYFLLFTCTRSVPYFLLGA